MLLDWVKKIFSEDVKNPVLGNPKIKFADVEKLNECLPNLMDFMALKDFDDDLKIGLLADGKSLVKFLDVQPFAAELITDDELIKKYQQISNMLADVPREERHYWHCQIFYYAEPDMDGLKDRIADYIDDDLKESKLSKEYVNIMNEHLDLVCKDGGMFEDPKTKAPFKGHTIRCRLVIYRKYPDCAVSDYDRDRAYQDLSDISHKFISTLKEVGCLVREMDESLLYSWFVRWFNPKPYLTEGSSKDLLKVYPIPKKRNFRWNLMEKCFFTPPESTEKGWKFDGVEHRVMFLSELENQPPIGTFSRDRFWNGRYASILNLMPEGTIYTLQIAFPSDDEVKDHLKKVGKRAMGKGSEPQKVKARVNRAYDEIGNSNPLLWVTHAIFYNDSSKEINLVERQIVDGLKLISAIKPYPFSFRKFQADDYIRLIPCNYSEQYQRSSMFVGHLYYCSEVAALMPVYGRSTGPKTDKKYGIEPLMTMFTGSGERFCFNSYSQGYKTNNSHMAVFGSTGSGKSVFLNYLILCLLATIKCRVVVLEAGGSFDLMTLYLKKMDKKIEYLKFDPTVPVPFNPYAEAYKMLDQVKREQARIKKQAEETLAGQELGIDASELIQKINDEAKEKLFNLLNNIDQDKNDDQDNRDIISELTVITTMMIETGDQDKPVTSAETGLIIDVLIDTIQACHDAKVLQVLPEHIMNGFKDYAEHSKDHRVRLLEFYQSMKKTLSGSLSAFFNKPSVIEDDFDYFHIDLGILKENGRKEELNIVAISLLSRVLAMCEKNQNEGVPTIFIMDEAHLLFQNDKIAAFAVLMAKVSRKINLQILPASQSFKDMTAKDVDKMLAMMDSLLILYLSESERKQFAEFRGLPENIVKLLKLARKEPKLYSEAVLVHEKWQGIFKNIPPKIALALAMTDPDEKVNRKNLSDTYGFSTLDAVEKIANDLKEMKFKESCDDAKFD